MISVAIEYRPFAFIPWTRTIEKKMPARWSEMNAKQIVSVPRIHSLSDRKLLQIFLGIKKSIAKRIDDYQAFCITRHLKYLSDPQPVDRFVIPSLLNFKAPQAKLRDVTFGQFMFGDSCYQDYTSGKREALNRFIACYYTYGTFDKKAIETNAKIIAATSPDARVAIAINYGLIREWLALVYPYVFQKAEEGKKNEADKGWLGVFDVVVGDDVVNEERYAQAPAHTILRYLNRKLKDYYKNGSKV